MNLKLTLVTHLLVGISLGVDGVVGLRCYVCGDDGELPCENFEVLKDTYIKECASDNQGCLKIAKGSQLTRTCNDRKFNQCLNANEVEYCYCFTDLCNDKIGHFVNPTDDEDLLEGSGTKTILSVTEKPSVTVRMSTGIKLELINVKSWNSICEERCILALLSHLLYIE